jgi:hypothetical protein
MPVCRIASEAGDFQAEYNTSFAHTPTSATNR